MNLINCIKCNKKIEKVASCMATCSSCNINYFSHPLSRNIYCIVYKNIHIANYTHSNGLLNQKLKVSITGQYSHYIDEEEFNSYQEIYDYLVRLSDNLIFQ